MGGRGSSSGFSSSRIVYAYHEGNDSVEITVKDHKYTIAETTNGNTVIRPLEGDELKQTMKVVQLINDPQVSRKSIDDKVAGLKVELEYAQMKAHEYGNIKYGGTRATREKYEMWSAEAKRLAAELDIAEKWQRKTMKKSNDDIPLF